MSRREYKGEERGKPTRGDKARGMRHVQSCIVTRVRVYIGMIEVMKDTSCI